MAGKSDEFIPYTSELGIPGSSYRLSMGVINGKWAVRLAKGDDILDSNVFQDSELDKIPNADDITRWVLMVLAIPNINPYQIMKSVGFIRQQAKRNYDDKGRVKITKQEVDAVALEKTPEDRILRPSSLGEVKDDGVVDAGASDAMKASNQSALAAPPPSKKRNLPSIPTAGAPADSSAPESRPGAGGVYSQLMPQNKESHATSCGSCGKEIKTCPHCGKPL